MKTNSPYQIKNGLVLPDQALKWLQTVEPLTIPPYFMTHWKTEKSFFHHDGALLAFESTKTHLVLNGEPLTCSKTDCDNLYRAFMDYALKKKKKVCGFYVGESWESSFFAKRHLGTSFRVLLKNYDLDSSKAKEVRRSLRKGQAQGFRVVAPQNIDAEKTRALTQKWKAKKLPIQLKFFLSELNLNSSVKEYEKIYAVEKNDQYFALCSTLPYKNKEAGGLYIDHLIHDPLSEKSALSFLVSSLILQLKSQGLDEINLGLNPFAEVPKKDLIGRLFSYLYLTPLFFRPKGLHYFKGKFAGQEEQEFFFYEKGSSALLSLYGMIKTNFTQKTHI